ncbi:SDR family oxidoreductase [Paenibacillus sp. TRM 82003]|uniref:SDR family oxidoreductase n=1 Tax=Kineococcus sp. TRM81007 TaxID=2925831 RepID=UPI001F5951FB|nr:SDR family oxidoreductase [Kineococcus sp. TRM81007]MCI2237752.1 SDR family oxidoreductase [Kineococcus sp. TRM81007]MCI3921770.1 SDR family oxidoreductase [Paenibacillus sp. TRM 82003]
MSAAATPLPDRAPTPVRTPPPGAHALVVGATGITGSTLVHQLVDAGWRTSGLSRRPPTTAGAAHVAADLLDADDLREQLADLHPTHLFINAWVRQESEARNIEVNAGIVRDLLAILGEQGSLQHVALVTGLKHYLGPFEAYGQGELPDTPFLEDAERLPVPNFYYAQEDELFAAAARHGFTWSVHRAHTVIGHAVGNAMNIVSTLGAYAAIVRESGRPFTFPGSLAQWNGVVDLTDAAQLADHQAWAATTPAAADTAFNIVNGDVVRWRRLWPTLAEHLGVQAQGPGEQPQPLEQQMAGAQEVWGRLVTEHQLLEPDLSRIASWWHTDSDLGRPIEVLADMTRSRLAGFTGYVSTERSLLRLLDRYRAERYLP